MKDIRSNRRDFLKNTSLAFLPIHEIEHKVKLKIDLKVNETTNQNLSIIGQYGEWASKLNSEKLPKLSFRNKNVTELKEWQKKAKAKTLALMAIPAIDKQLPKIETIETFTYDGLYFEKLAWQLPYGRGTEAYIIKPIGVTKKLPAVLALHDHGGNKFFGTQKIIKTNNNQNILIKNHQAEYYDNNAWANELAKRGYVVLVFDAFAFGSRRVFLEDVPIPQREGLTDFNYDNPANIETYNAWASQHEHIMARSLFSAGTTWPGVFFQEDKIALDILSGRQDVDNQNIGCCGLSGGGLRSTYLGGLDNRIKCAIPVGFMTTWTDFILNKSFTHTWMTYIPLLPNELDFPEILGIRTPLPTLVLNNINDNLFTLSEMKKADTILSDIYKKANAEKNYKCSFYPGPHKFDKKMQTEAFDWFDKWLKN
jgi:dienelactone hydrolase